MQRKLPKTAQRLLLFLGFRRARRLWLQTGLLYLGANSVLFGWADSPRATQQRPLPPPRTRISVVAHVRVCTREQPNRRQHAAQRVPHITRSQTVAACNALACASTFARRVRPLLPAGTR